MAQGTQQKTNRSGRCSEGYLYEMEFIEDKWPRAIDCQRTLSQETELREYTKTMVHVGEDVNTSRFVPKTIQTLLD